MSFRKAFFAQGNAGFSILEGMVGAVVGGLVIYGLSAGMTQSLRVAKSVEMKTEINDFQQLLALSLSSAENAMKLLQAEGELTTPKLPTSFSDLPQSGMRCDESPTATSNRCQQVQLSKLKLVDGLVYESSGRVGSNLKFESARLVVLNMTSEKVPVASPGLKQRREYYAKLYYTLARRGSGQGGVETISKSYPMLVDIEKTDDRTLKLISAYGVGQNDNGSEVCEKMGGTWLKNSDSKYFSRERCHFGGEINLSASEWPDVLNQNGAISTTGFRPLACLYKDINGALQTYLCPGRTPTSRRIGNVCRFDGAQWKFSYISAFTGNTPTYSPTYENRFCTAGVTAGKNSDASIQLAWNAPLATAYGDLNHFVSNEFNLAEYVAESDRLNSVLRCQPKHDADQWVPCINGTNPALARAGGKGACVYLRNGVISGISNLGLASPPNVNNYTGWMYVSTARTTGMVRNPDGLAVPTITEAKGTPCFQVEVMTSMYRSNEFADAQPIQALGGLAFADFQNVAQCVVELSPTRGTAPAGSPGLSRFTTLSCDRNAGLEGDPMTWTEILGDSSRLLDALQSLKIVTGGTSESPTYGNAVRRINTAALPAGSGPSGATLTSIEQLDKYDVVKVETDVDDDDSPEKCLFRRVGSGLWWGGQTYSSYSLSNMFPGTPHELWNTDKRATDTRVTSAGVIDKQTAALSLNSTSEPRISFSYDGESYYRISQSGAFFPAVACTRASDLDLIPWKSLNDLKAAIAKQVTIENSRDSEYLTLDTCAYFEEVAVINRANAKPGAKKDFKWDLSSQSIGSYSYDPPSGWTIPTSLLTADILRMNGKISDTNDLNKRYTGWLWLSKGIPVQRFRIDDDRAVIWNAGARAFQVAENAGFQSSTLIKFKQLEMYYASGWVPLPQLSTKVNNQPYFFTMGAFNAANTAATPTSASTTHETNVAQRRPVVPIAGELCTRGIRRRN